MPKRIAIHYQYYGDADLPIDEAVVKRIREDLDPSFVPVLKKEIFLYDTGDRVVFRNFGVGLEEGPNLPILNKPVYYAEKPRSGYLSTIGRAVAIVEWWPWTRKADGTPGDTIPFGGWFYDDLRRRTEFSRDLEARSTVPDGAIPTGADEIRARAIKAHDQQSVEKFIAENKASEKVIKEAEAEYAKEGKFVLQTLTELTEDELREVRHLMRNSDAMVKGRKSVSVPSRLIIP